MSDFPAQICNLPKFEGPFDAFKLGGDGCDVIFASYPASTSIPKHRHETENVGIITRGELVLIMDGTERRFGPGDWYHVPSGALHAARFDVATSEIGFRFLVG
jgi:quercetin dioxygenase-like cupin family protein